MSRTWERRSAAVVSLGALGALVLEAAGCPGFDAIGVSSTTSTGSTSAGTSTDTGTSGAGGTTSSSVTGGAGGSGGDPGPEVQCDPLAGVVDPSCGIFVQEGAVGGDGSQAKPYGSIDAALIEVTPNNRRVYVCGESFPVGAGMVLTKSVTMYGGLACDAAGWTSGAARTALAPDPQQAGIPLVIQGVGTEVELHSFSVTAPPASASSGSSTAVMVNGATAAFVDCALTAGDGMAGDDGLDVPPDSPRPMQAPKGGKGDDASATPALTGGAGADNPDCGLRGGDGGSAAAPGGPGHSGAAGDSGSGAPGGLGQAGASTCEAGKPGADGPPSPAASGGKTVGCIAAGGYVGVHGMAGAAGAAGKSGGGGGGSRGAAPTYGAGGGGGGAGGCGGIGGDRGMAGGGSIVVISVNAVVTFSGCSLTAGNGGLGGKGKAGQGGQIGGEGGDGGYAGGGVLPGCNGGPGGHGADGAYGGGGRGGHSVLVAYTGGLPPDLSTCVATYGTPGPGGDGGLWTDPANNGDPGIAAEVLDIPSCN